MVLRQRGWSYRRIAGELGIDRETVSRHVRAAHQAANAAISTAGTEAPEGPPRTAPETHGGAGEACGPGEPTAGPSGPEARSATNAHAGNQAPPPRNAAISSAGTEGPDRRSEAALRTDGGDGSTFGPGQPTVGPAGSGGPCAPDGIGGDTAVIPPNAAISTTGNPGRPGHCEPFRAVILEALERGLSRQRIFQDLVTEHDFAGSYASVKRFVQRLAQAVPLPFRRMECEPGQEAQVDFGRGAAIVEPGHKRRVPRLFRILLSYSRKAYSEVVWRETTETFIRCLENAFRTWGGVPKTLVIDNLRAAVTRADWYDPDLNPKVEAFARHYGTVILPTKPAMPRHKGKVERAVGYAQTNALKGRTFPSLTGENQHLAWWETNVADHRIHGTTRHQVQERFLKHERPALLPLPPMPFPCFEEAPRTVHRDAHVEVDKAYYSVPPEYVGRRVWVRWDARLVRIFNTAFTQIAVHVRHEKGRFSTDPKHLAAEKIAGVERGAEWLLRRVALIGPHTADWARAMLDARGIQGVRVLQGLLVLAGHHRGQAIEQACQSALPLGAFRLRALRDLIQGDTRQETLDFATEHALIRPLIEYGRLIPVSFRETGEGKGGKEETEPPTAFIAFRADGGDEQEKGPVLARALPAVQPPVAALGSDASGALSSGLASEAYSEDYALSTTLEGGSHE